MTIIQRNKHNKRESKTMKLSNYYTFIKERMLTKLNERGYTIDDLKNIFAATAQEYGFKRACVRIGCQFTKFWINEVTENSNMTIQNNHIHTVYRRFFKELGFNDN